MKSVSAETQLQCIEEFSSTVVQLPRSALYAETETIRHLATEVQNHVSLFPETGFVHQRLDEFALVIEPYVQGEDTASLSEASMAVPSRLQTGNDHTLDNTGYYLLSLDGGGVHGLSTLYILQGIMNRLNYMREEAGLRPRKPCEIFDLIGGTSTGG
jgi:hypothetical protein